MNNQNEKKLVAYVTSSFPENNFSIDLILGLKEAGVDTVELGIPFSDPVADGPVIEKANLLALKNGFKLNDLFEVSKAVAPQIDTMWMGYMNPFFAYGVENMLQKADEFGVNGTIIPDLPFEMTKTYSAMFEKYNKSNITFVAPTDSDKRIEELVKDAQKFIYMVAYAGITGSGQEEDLSSVISSIKEHTKTPIYLGFGVDEKTCKEKSKNVDGVIVGSAFVKRLIDDSLSNNEKMKQITSLAKEIKEKINE